MRKAIIRVRSNALLRKLIGDMFEKVDHIEGRELLRIDFERATKLVIADFVMREGYTFEDLKTPKGVEFMNVLKVDGNRYTVLMKGNAPGKKFQAVMKLFDLSVIYDMPYYMDKEHFKFTVIGEPESIQKVVHVIRIFGKVEGISFTKVLFNDLNILDVLTEKQKQILIAAKKYGYYEYPRKVTTKDLSEKIGISKATTVEHLRKAEIRLMDSLLEGFA